jgi:DNA recombination protein RmuC
MEILLLLLGLIVGFGGAWFIAKFKFSSEKDQTKATELIQLNEKLARAETENKYLLEKIEQGKTELEEQQKMLRMEFSNLANSLLEEKSKRFVEINEKNIGNILNPLKEKLKEFEQKVDETYKEETRERISLKKEIEQIVKLNLQVSEDTNRLTSALKGDKKLQGDWGEIQLEMILEKAGLENGIHYNKQQSFRTEDGELFRPDFTINLPDGKNLVLDSKVSLVAYENYYNTEDDNQKARFLKEHVAALYKHITELSNKNYTQLYGINSPDYVLMFVSLEPALTSALKEDLSLYEKALDKNIVLVSGSTLLATLRTISYIWKQENQKRNVVEIAKESGALYDKFVGFTEDLSKIGRSMEDAQKSYHEAMNKLTESAKKGDTIIGRFERIKKLGANASKSLPQNLIDKAE